MDEITKDVGPSKVWYYIAMLILLLVVIGGPTWLIIRLVSGFSSGHQFLVPGTHTFNFKSPGKHIIWNDSQTFFNGRSYSSSPSLPDGLTIKVIQRASQNQISTKTTGSSSESSGSHKRYSICSFLVEKSGEYTIEVKNVPSQRVFMLRKSQLKYVLHSLFACSTVLLVGWTIGFSIIITVAVKRSRASKELGSARHEASNLPS